MLTWICAACTTSPLHVITFNGGDSTIATADNIHLHTYIDENGPELIGEQNAAIDVILLVIIITFFLAPCIYVSRPSASVKEEPVLSGSCLDRLKSKVGVQLVLVAILSFSSSFYFFINAEFSSILLLLTVLVTACQLVAFFRNTQFLALALCISLPAMDYYLVEAWRDAAFYVPLLANWMAFILLGVEVAGEVSVLLKASAPTSCRDLCSAQVYPIISLPLGLVGAALVAAAHDEFQWLGVWVVYALCAGEVALATGGGGEHEVTWLALVVASFTSAEVLVEATPFSINAAVGAIFCVLALLGLCSSLCAQLCPASNAWALAVPPATIPGARVAFGLQLLLLLFAIIGACQSIPQDALLGVLSCGVVVLSVVVRCLSHEAARGPLLVAIFSVLSSLLPKLLLVATSSYSTWALGAFMCLLAASLAPLVGWEGFVSCSRSDWAFACSKLTNSAHIGRIAGLVLLNWLGVLVWMAARAAANCPVGTSASLCALAPVIALWCWAQYTEAGPKALGLFVCLNAAVWAGLEASEERDVLAALGMLAAMISLLLLGLSFFHATLVSLQAGGYDSIFSQTEEPGHDTSQGGKKSTNTNTGMFFNDFKPSGYQEGGLGEQVFPNSLDPDASVFDQSSSNISTVNHTAHAYQPSSELNESQALL